MSERVRRIVVIGIVVIMAGSVVGVAMVGQRTDRSAQDPVGAPTITAGPTPAAPVTPAPTPAVACEEPAPEPSPPAPVDTGYCSAPPRVIDPARSYRATIATTRGDIVVELRADRSPVAVNNLVYLARDGYYRNVPFHRVKPGFVVQGGDPTGTGSGCLDPACSRRLPGYRFRDELGLAEEIHGEHGGYHRGTVAMANAGADTNGSQFFIVLGEVVPLEPAFTVLGRVVEGMDVVDAIAEGPTGDRITESPVRITDVTVAVGDG